ncbi:hypothetical protein GUJ93_ZPchr0007g5219 [Zizania palustris]|uniref:Uncharacterized protein n=1 Tax=Zizania palustris TaxID=103762 RepID=A0A8J5SQP4_ZIZPA|nr:hypothetical protein GUJ93_ZPchr0007g5219 [Zizania palustris]
MAPASLAAPIASISPSSAGRATLAAFAAGGLRSSRTTCSSLGQTPGLKSTGIAHPSFSCPLGFLGFRDCHMSNLRRCSREAQ